MKLKARLIGLEAGGEAIAILNKADAETLAVRSLGRIRLRVRGREIVSIVDLTTRIVKEGEVGVSEGVRSRLKLREGEVVEVEVTELPRSLRYIKQKLKGRKLNAQEIHEIVQDVVKGSLNSSEIASFVTALDMWGIDLDEAAALTLAMVETGEMLKLRKRIIADKHSIGGGLGDKTSLLLVPLIAASGLTIPKTSSRAITSPAGTADRAEVLMPVDLNIEEMEEVVKATNGCIAWGGALHLAPADDLFIKVEYPLGIDPLLLPSIMAKKKAVGATHLVLDIPCGRGTKIKTIGDANLLAIDFIHLANALNIKARCAVTYGEEPIGYTIGPALEAREALEVLMRRKQVPDLRDKVLDLSTILLKMVGRKNARAMAREILRSGKAEKKLREIIEAQGGEADVRPEDLLIGRFNLSFNSQSDGYVLWISNPTLVQLARVAGSPQDKGAGIVLHKKTGDVVKKGEELLTVYAERRRNLREAERMLEEVIPMGVGKRREMLIHEVKEVPVHRKIFILER